MSLFAYQTGKSRLHRIDPRCKLLSLAAISLTALNADPKGLLILSLFALSLMAGFSLFSLGLFSRLRFLLLFLFMVWIARALFTPGHPLVSLSFATLTREGLLQGTMLCWRVLLVVLFSVVFTATTRTAQIREALHRLLRPLPFLPSKRLADMMGLMIRFIPVIFGRMGEILEAQRARAVDNRKNPVYRMKRLALPLLQGLFVDAHALSEAMEARCYRQQATPPPLPFGNTDRAALIVILILCLGCLMV